MGAIASLILVWAVAVAVDLLMAVRHVRQGTQQVQAARDTLSANGLLSGAPMVPLRSAASSFASAQRLLSSPILWPIDVLPVLGRQLRSVQALASAAGQVSRTGVTTVGQAQELLKLPHTAGPDRIRALHRLVHLASSTHAALSNINLGPSQALIGTLASERAKFSKELNQVQTTLARTSAAASAAASILQGPQNYLLLTGNNAEMRSGSGSFLEAGIVTTGNGELHLSGIQPTTSLTVPVGGVPVGGDLNARWGWLLPGVDWRNLGLTPQFDVNGALAARMWKFKTGQQVDGVMQLDVVGLRELLTVTGPVTTATGLVVSAENVDQLLLHDQYNGEGYGDVATLAARVDQLGTISTAMMHALETRPLELHAMVNALSAETSGRHIMLWSANPATEAVWRSTGVSGQLTSTTLASNVINRGGNKLDQYVTMSSTLDLVTHGERTSATMNVSLSNHTPAGQSPYIAGPYTGSGLHYGEYLGIVAVNLPNDVRNLAVGTGDKVVVNGQEGPTLLVGINVDMLPGASRQITLHFSLPQSHGTLTVMPSARIPPESWNVDGEAFTDATTHTVSW